MELSPSSRRICVWRGREKVFKRSARTNIPGAIWEPQRILRELPKNSSEGLRNPHSEQPRKAKASPPRTRRLHKGLAKRAFVISFVFLRGCCCFLCGCCCFLC